MWKMLQVRHRKNKRHKKWGYIKLYFENSAQFQGLEQHSSNID